MQGGGEGPEAMEHGEVGGVRVIKGRVAKLEGGRKEAVDLWGTERDF